MVRYQKLKVKNTDDINVYYMDSKLSPHDLHALDYYAELKSAGADIKYFARNVSCMNDNYFLHAFLFYTYNNNAYFDVIETKWSHSLHKVKYLDTFNSGELQTKSNQLFKDAHFTNEKPIGFPRLILIDNTKHHAEYLAITKGINVIQLDYKFENLIDVFFSPSTLLK